MFQRISEEGLRAALGVEWKMAAKKARAGRTPRLHSFSSAHHLDVNAGVHHGAMVHHGGVVGDVLPGQHGLGLRLQRTVATHGATAVRRHLEAKHRLLLLGKALLSLVHLLLLLCQLLLLLLQLLLLQAPDQLKLLPGQHWLLFSTLLLVSLQGKNLIPT